jgi:predicted ATPase
MSSNGKSPAELDLLTKLAVDGFKSISTALEIQLKPLTVLAGTNSSGKSSIMQPLLLLKQSLELSYDPGPLYLSGPNTKFTNFDKMISIDGKSSS